MRAAWSRVDEPNDTMAAERRPASSCRPDASWVTGLYAPVWCPSAGLVAHRLVDAMPRLTCTWHVGVLVAAAEAAFGADAPGGAALLVAQQLLQ